MANELATQTSAAREIVSVFKALGPNQQAAVLCTGIVVVGGGLVFGWCRAMELGYEFNWDRNGARMFRPDGAVNLAAAS